MRPFAETCYELQLSAIYDCTFPDLGSSFAQFPPTTREEEGSFVSTISSIRCFVGVYSAQDSKSETGTVGERILLYGL
jgi:hypothetical protein